MPERKQKVAVITGAAQGLGYAIAQELSKTCRCVLIDQTPMVEKSAKWIQDGIGIVADVSDENSIANAIQRIDKEFGRLDVLVNNAGIHPRAADGAIASIENISLEDWEQVLRVNLTGMFMMTKAALPLLRKSKAGRIINMSSRTGRAYTGTSSIAYATSKGGVIAFTRQIAGSEGKYGITANALAPGSIRSPMTSESGEAGYSLRASRTVVGRIGEPEDVATAVAFLASESSGYLTGATLDLNGGSLMI